MNIYKIEPLTSTNYETWSQDVKFLLLRENCFDIVIGKETVPVISDKISQKDVDDFEVRKRAALSMLYMNVHSEYRKTIQHFEHPHEIWKFLESNFRPDSRAYHMQTFTELMQCGLNRNESINLYASRLKSLSGQLETTGSGIDEVFVIYQFLRNLPSKYDPVIQNILRWEDKKFKFKDVILEMVAEETRLSFREKTKSTQSQVFSTNRTVRCFKCNRRGHVQRFCGYRSDGYSSTDSGLQKYPSPRTGYGGRLPASTVSSTSKDFSCSDEFPRRSFDDRRQRSTSPRNRTSKEQFGKKFSFFIAEANTGEPSSTNMWLLDTAANVHFCNNRGSFTKFNNVTNEKMILAVNGVDFPVEGRGDVQVCFNGNLCKLNNVLFSSRLRRNLISGPLLDKNGYRFVGGNRKIDVFLDNDRVFTAKLENGLYYVHPSIKPDCNLINSKNLENLKIWHESFGHANIGAIIKTSQLQAVRGLPNLKTEKDLFSCEPCKLNKHRKVSFKSVEIKRARSALEVLSLDLWGPSNVVGKNGERYYLSVIDGFSGYMTLYPLKDKLDVFDVFERHVLRAERFLGVKVKAIHTDNGGEFKNDFFKDFCDKNGISHEFTNVYTPQQNASAERLNQTVLDGARTMIYESGLDKKFWPEAVLAFVYGWNRLCHSNQSKTPMEMYMKRKPSVRHLKRFGEVAYVGIPRQLRGKLDQKAKKGFMVGYALKTRGYRIYLPEEQKIVETANVRFSNQKGFTQGAVLEPEIEEYHPLESLVSNRNRDREYDRESVSHAPTTLAKKDSSDESSSESDSESDLEGTKNRIIDQREVKWRRIVKPRKDRSRNDVYFQEEGTDSKLECLKHIREYCKENKIKLDESLFNFSGKDRFQGIINPQSSTSGIEVKKNDSS